MLTINYVGLADRTAKPIAAKPKTRRGSDWAWKPYRAAGQMNGRITVTRLMPGDETGMVLQRRSFQPKAAKREPRG